MQELTVNEAKALLLGIGSWGYVEFKGEYNTSIIVMHRSTEITYGIKEKNNMIVSKAEFTKAFQQARKISQRVADATDENPPDKGIFILSAGGAAGVVVCDGEIKCLFNTGVKGAGADLVREAIERGAYKLDCFAYLVPYYEQFGFSTYHIEPNWNGADFPGVHYMTLR